MNLREQRKHLLRRNKADVIFDCCNFLFLLLIFILIAYPLYFVVIASFSDPYLVEHGDVWLFPKGFTLMGYQKIFNEKRIWIGFRNSIIYTVLGVLVSLILTLPASYALSRDDLPGQKGLSFFCVFTMLFNGGLVATYYIVAHTLKLENTLAAMILPSAVSVYHLMIARTFMKTSIPAELREAAAIDGCDEAKFFFSVVLPLSKSLIATLVLMFGVLRWNSYVDALLYLTEASRFPLQTIIKELLLAADSLQQFDSGTSSNILNQQQIATLMRYSVILVCNIPIIIVYPLIQKFLVKGVLLGAVKE
ncbi:MAG: carbohydrate ABC transporter permease [Clostridiales bacterium]|nr:carbohydrate ABC transporter permease [Clostridiales bacterium]